MSGAVCCLFSGGLVVVEVIRNGLGAEDEDENDWPLVEGAMGPLGAT